MVEDPIRSAVAAYLKTVEDNGIPISFGVIFGSQAKGTAHEWSGIDLVVVSARFDNMSGREDIHLLWWVAANTDARIEPIPCGEAQWRDDDSRAIIEVARLEGEVVRM
ncbi:MAG: nucleotidyltransferase domain-containing protein [Deltaproteobacteria bacterium]|nr:nucleotidyltransferase domain-containing protein [Deltaproteobacteria bacterium]